MNAHTILERMARTFLLVAVAAALLSSGAPASAQAVFPAADGRPSEVTEVAQQGLGDRQNSYAWSMAWWKGKLYVGTGRASFCVQQATVQFFQTGTPTGRYYPVKDKDIACTPDPHDLDLMAEIWRWTPDAVNPIGQPGTWDRVYPGAVRPPAGTDPNDVPIQGTNPQKYTARDIGYRGMLVFTEADGTEALYVAGDSTRGGPKEGFDGPVGFDGQVPPPRILRSTDGVTFEALPQTPGTLLGDTEASGFRSLVSLNHKLYVVATVGQLGHGAIYEAEHPELQGRDGYDAFRLISPPGMTFFEIEVYNGFLWAGTGVNPHNSDTPFSLLKTNATGELPYTFTTVIPEGAYGKKPSAAVISLAAFRTKADLLANRPGRLYVGTDKEVLRVNPDDSWDLVVGPPRKAPDGRKLDPISGFVTGWDNFFNIHMWRMGSYPAPPFTAQSVPWLYIGTNDQSTKWRNLKGGLGAMLKPNMGFDLYATSDGWHYSAVSRDGFGDLFNSGMRTFTPTPYGLFMGTSNHFYGTRIYRGANVPNPVATPQRLEVESSLKIAGLTWEGGCPTATATTFHVYRSTGFSKPAEIASIPGTSAAGCGHLDTTLKPFTVYHYYVVAETDGKFSEPSNTVRAPFKGPVPTFQSLETLLASWSAPTTLTDPLASAKGLIAAAELPNDYQKYTDAINALKGMAGLLATQPPLVPAYRNEDVGVLLTKFIRRVVLAQAGLLPKKFLMK
jgi:hypothetical protein